MKIQKLIAFFMSSVMTLSAMSVHSFSTYAETSKITEQTSEINRSELQYDGLLGSMLSDEISESAEEKQEVINSDYAVYKLSYDKEVDCVGIDYHALNDCTIFVGFYNDEGTELITSVTKELKADSKGFVELYAQDTLPEYFLIKAFMVDSQFLNPLSKPYVYNKCTYQMQEILKQTTADYEGEQVVNLDDNDSNNFVVLHDDVKEITPTETTDIYIGEDENGNYIFENAVEIAELKKGDKAFVNVYPNMVAFIVDSIETDGNRSIISRTEAKFGDFIKFLKVNSEEYTGDSNPYDDNDAAERSQLPQPLVPDSESEDNKLFPKPLPFIEKEFEINPQGNIDFNHDFDIETPFSFTGASGKIKTIINGPVEIYYYHDPNEKDFFSLSVDIDFTTEITLGVSCDLINLDELRIPIFTVGIATIYFVPEFTITAKAEGTIGFKRNFYLNLDSDGEFMCYYSEPEITKINGSITLEFGLHASFQLDLIAFTFLKVSPGVVWEVSVGEDYNPNDPKDEYIRHDCQNCYDGKVSWHMEIDIALCAEVWGMDEFGVERHFPIEGKDHEIKSFYIKDGISYSGNCSNKSHKIILNVYEKGKDESSKGSPAKNAKLYILDKNNATVPLKDDDGKEVSTNDEGQAKVWVKDEILLRDGCIISAVGTNGDKGQIIVEEQFDNKLKQPNSFEIILNNEQPVPEYPKTGNCGIDMDKAELHVWDKTKTNSFEYSYYPASYFKRDNPKYCYWLYYQPVNDKVQYSLDENGELRFDGDGFCKYTDINRLSADNNINTVRIGFGVLASCLKEEKDTGEEWKIGMHVNDCNFYKGDVLDETISSFVKELYFEGNNGDAIVDYFANKNTYLSKIYLSEFETIGSHAFDKCTNLSYVYMPDTVESIGEYAFSETNLDKFDCPNNLKKIDQYAFYKSSKLENVYFNYGLEEIGTNSFSDTAVKSVDLPSTVKNIGYGAFNNTPLKRIAIRYRDCTINDLPKNITVYGYMNSTAHKYVLEHPKNNLKFVPFDPETPDTISSKITTSTSKQTTTTTTTTTAATTTVPKKTVIVTTNITADSQCVFMAVKDAEDISADKVMEKDNVKFFDQQKADSDGIVSFSYLTDEKEKLAFIFVSEAINHVITQSFGTPDSLTTTKCVYGEGVKGDANADGQLDMSDVVLIMQSLANPNKYGINGIAPSHITVEGTMFGDTDGDGLTGMDALRIQQYLLGLIPSLA